MQREDKGGALGTHGIFMGSSCSENSSGNLVHMSILLCHWQNKIFLKRRLYMKVDDLSH